jgi:hypothetical protein
VRELDFMQIAAEMRMCARRRALVDREPLTRFSARILVKPRQPCHIRRPQVMQPSAAGAQHVGSYPTTRMGYSR